MAELYDATFSPCQTETQLILKYLVSPSKLEMVVDDDTCSSPAERDNTGENEPLDSKLEISFCNFYGKSSMTFVLIKN